MINDITVKDGKKSFEIQRSLGVPTRIVWRKSRNLKEVIDDYKFKSKFVLIISNRWYFYNDLFNELFNLFICDIKPG